MMTTERTTVKRHTVTQLRKMIRENPRYRESFIELANNGLFANERYWFLIPTAEEQAKLGGDVNTEELSETRTDSIRHCIRNYGDAALNDRRCGKSMMLTQCREPFVRPGRNYGGKDIETTIVRFAGKIRTSELGSVEWSMEAADLNAKFVADILHRHPDAIPYWDFGKLSPVCFIDAGIHVVGGIMPIED